MSYRTPILLLDGDGRILCRNNGSQISLPELDIEAGRAGISLTRAVSGQLHLEIFCLVLSGATESALPVACLQSSTSSLPIGCFWVHREELSLIEPISSSVELAIKAAAETTDRFGGQRWYAKVVEWLKERLSQFGYELKQLEQWNGRVGGVLFRVLTSGPVFWLKSVSDFNLREMQIAQLLAAKHPVRFPRIVATNTEWNTFLLEHVNGEELYERDDLDTWKLVANTLADTQMGWMSQQDQLLRAGAADLRASAMIQRIPVFLNHVSDAMARQETQPPEMLSRPQLADLGELLQRLCEEVAQLPLADGLANADFSPHNTLITTKGPVFIDWAEACVSLPLIAGEYMWNRMVVESPERRPWQEHLRNSYLSRWAQEFGAATVARAADFLPAFSLLAVAMFYHERECHGPSPYDKYLRSLARKLNHSVQTLELNAIAIQA